jgi:hypothetical protein
MSGIFFLWQTVASTQHHWKLGIVQSKKSSSTKNKELLIKLPETAAIVAVSSEIFGSVKEKDRICVEYSHNLMTKEVAVFSYDISSKCKQKGRV